MYFRNSPPNRKEVQFSRIERRYNLLDVFLEKRKYELASLSFENGKIFIAAPNKMVRRVLQIFPRGLFEQILKYQEEEILTDLEYLSDHCFEAAIDLNKHFFLGMKMLVLFQLM